MDRELAIFLNLILVLEFGDNWIRSGAAYRARRNLRTLRAFSQSIALFALVVATLIRTLFIYFTPAGQPAARPTDIGTIFITFLLWGIALVVGTVTFITWRRE